MSTPADTFTDRTDATDEEFRARVAKFDAAEEPEEVVVERMAAAMWEKDPDGPWEGALDEDRDYFRMLATAALAALRGDRG